MLRQTLSSSKSLVLSLALGLVASAGLAGCSETGQDGEPAEPDVTNVLVTAESISELKAGETYKADLTHSNVVYRFDYSKAPIDYSRVSLVVEGSDAVSLEQQMEFVQSRSYGGNPKPDLLGAPDKRFSVASEPASFGTLDSGELEALESTGYYYKFTKGEPTSTPQSMDNCIYATCVICVDPATGAVWDWSTPGTPVCFYEEHVWCD